MVGDRIDNDIGPAESQGRNAARVLQGFHRFEEPRGPQEKAEKSIGYRDGPGVDAFLAPVFPMAEGLAPSRIDAALMVALQALTDLRDAPDVDPDLRGQVDHKVDF